MSASVTRRIRRNMREIETGHRSPRGRGRFRGLNPLQKAHAEKQWKALHSAAKIASEGRKRMKDEHGKGVR